jgi:hypothetical protein
MRVVGQTKREPEMRKRVSRMLPWWGLAAVVGWFLLPALVESLEVAVKGNDVRMAGAGA